MIKLQSLITEANWNPFKKHKANKQLQHTAEVIAYHWTNKLDINSTYNDTQKVWKQLVAKDKDYKSGSEELQFLVKQQWDSFLEDDLGMYLK